MDRDAGEHDRGDEARQGDTGMLGSESEEPGPGRDTSLTDPDPVAAGTDQPRTPVAMSEGDPMRTRLGSHVEGAGVIGYDVAAAEEGATQQTPTDDRPGYAAERLRPGEEPIDEPSVAAAPPVADSGSSQLDPAPAESVSAVDDAPYERRPDEPSQDLPATYTGEEADVTQRPEYAERAEGADQPLYQEEPQRMDRSGGGGSLFTDDEPERLDRPGPQEPGVDEGVYDQEADQARQQRPSDGR